MKDLSTCRAAAAEHAPLVQCITNTVVQQFTANVLLAVGAAPAMFDHEADAAQFARVADGLLVNFGTATSQQFLGAEAAIDGAQDSLAPWVLDPVSLGVGDYRSSRILAAARRRPTVVRGNASEIAALAGTGSGARGTDAVDSVESALPAAARLSRELGAVVAISGPVDAVVQTSAHPDGAATVRIARISGGHGLMPLVIGTGCALGAVVAAYVAAVGASTGAASGVIGAAGAPAPGDGAGAAFGGNGIDTFTATAAAHAHFAVAGAAAGAAAKGPGTFAVEFIDALYAADAEAVAGAHTAVESIDFDELLGRSAAGHHTGKNSYENGQEDGPR